MAEDCRAQNGPGAPVFQIIHLQSMFEKVLSQIFVKRIFSREIGFSMTPARAIFRVPCFATAKAYWRAYMTF